METAGDVVTTVPSDTRGDGKEERRLKWQVGRDKVESDAQYNV